MDFEAPLRTLDDARTFFHVYGCSHFHMAREHHLRHAEYQAMGIAKETERGWMREALQIQERALRGLCEPTVKASEPCSIHAHLCELADWLAEPKALEMALQATLGLEPTLRGGARLHAAESLVGRYPVASRRGPVFRAAAAGRIDLADGMLACVKRLLGPAWWPRRDPQRRRAAHRAVAQMREAIARGDVHPDPNT